MSKTTDDPEDEFGALLAMARKKREAATAREREEKAFRLALIAAPIYATLTPGPDTYRSKENLAIDAAEDLLEAARRRTTGGV
jgi:hypothetical protein